MTDQLDLFTSLEREPKTTGTARVSSEATAEPTSRPEHSCDRCGSTTDVMYGQCATCAGWDNAA